ncbi:hypothetical protein HDG37_006474 [Paraburkholderia sp. MM5384-R2]|nr:hypothetical protein [Paraburkholderia sp. MM5384-R2]
MFVVAVGGHTGNHRRTRIINHRSPQGVELQQDLLAKSRSRNGQERSSLPDTRERGLPVAASMRAPLSHWNTLRLTQY